LNNCVEFGMKSKWMAIQLSLIDSRKKKGSKMIPISPSNTMIYDGWYNLGIYREYLHILLHLMLILKNFCFIYV
jgi:hypothetical protein